MSHTMKVDVKLGFIRWKNTDEPIPVVLAGSPDELNTNSVLDGVLTLKPSKLYEIMKSANERGLKPILELTIAEDPKPGLPTNKDDKQEKLPLDRKSRESEKGENGENPPAETGQGRDASGKFLKKGVDKKPNVK